MSSATLERMAARQRADETLAAEAQEAASVELEAIAEAAFQGEELDEERVTAVLECAGKTVGDLWAMVDEKRRIAALKDAVTKGDGATSERCSLEAEINAKALEFAGLHKNYIAEIRQLLARQKELDPVISAARRAAVDLVERGDASIAEQDARLKADLLAIGDDTNLQKLLGNALGTLSICREQWQDEVAQHSGVPHHERSVDQARQRVDAEEKNVENYRREIEDRAARRREILEARARLKCIATGKPIEDIYSGRQFRLVKDMGIITVHAETAVEYKAGTILFESQLSAGALAVLMRQHHVEEVTGSAAGIGTDSERPLAAGPTLYKLTRIVCDDEKALPYPEGSVVTVKEVGADLLQRMLNRGHACAQAHMVRTVDCGNGSAHAHVVPEE